jgi:DNA replication protein DnaC
MESIGISVLRHMYMPYSLKHAKLAWVEIAKSISKTPENKKFKPGDTQGKVWTELIKYIHGDKDCAYKLHKSICLLGGTGGGKTMTMKIMNKYMEYDNIHYIRNNINMSFRFNIISSREIVAEYSSNGYDGIAKYMVIGNLCIDDLGSEPDASSYYGNKLNVLSEIIETRYNKGLFTHFTSNLNEKLIKEKYDDRVYSRVIHQSNIIILNDKDYRVE